MALFKISRGLKEKLPVTKTSGHCWYTIDDSMFYIDYEDENGEAQRQALNAQDAQTLTGASLSTILNSSEIEIPTSKAVFDVLATKVSFTETQELTEEQKEQARTNIGAINTDYLHYQLPPIYRTEESQASATTMGLKIYINLRDLTPNVDYCFNADVQILDKTYAAYQVKYIVVCDDGTEFSLLTYMSTNIPFSSKTLKVSSISTAGNISSMICEYDINNRYEVYGAFDTASNLAKKTALNKYLGVTNTLEYTPTSNYHPATKKYVDDAVGNMPAQVQPDWCQNDETAPDYIKNRTHWEEDEITTVVLVPETTVYIDGELFVEEAIHIELVEGQAYTVVWNNTTYECVCYSYDGCNVIGNNACWDGDDGNGEPFMVSNYDGLTAINVFDEGTYTISISSSQRFIHKLDPKYLPDNLATKEYIDTVVSTIPEQVQADWNQTDTTAPDYIRNKPDLSKLQEDVKDYILLNDSITGLTYRIEIQNGNLVSSLHASLDDFTYTTNDDGTKTITGWNQTYLGEPSTEMIVPSDGTVII